MGPDQDGVSGPPAEPTGFAAAAHAFALLVASIPGDAWGGPGLGAWDLRALVGHASRSLVTVSSYLRQPAARADISSPAEYYARVLASPAAAEQDAVVERGRAAGRLLGADPAAAVERLRQRALADVAAAGDPLITVIGGLGIRLSAYLPTRTFELAVHGCDIARATGLPFALPAGVLAETAALAARIGAARGHGEAVLLALTGREPLAASFSVV